MEPRDPVRLVRFLDTAKNIRFLIIGGQTLARKQARTPRSQVRSALRQLWLRSRERQAALKRDKYTCANCYVKQSKAKGREVKVEVHHVAGVLNWDRLFDYMENHLLCDPKYLETLCKECHAKRG